MFIFIFNRLKIDKFCIKAFDNLFEAMFKDEKLDLEVEVEAMQMALKRDGLV